MDSLCPKIEPKFMIFLYKFLFHKIEKYENELFDKFSEISFFFLLIPIKNPWFDIIWACFELWKAKLIFAFLKSI